MRGVYDIIVALGNAPVTLQIKLVGNQQNVASCSRLLEVAGTLFTVATRLLHAQNRLTPQNPD